MTQSGNFLEELTSRIETHKDIFILTMLCVALKIPQTDKDKKDRILKLIQVLKETDEGIYNDIYEYCWKNLRKYTGVQP